MFWLLLLFDGLFAIPFEMNFLQRILGKAPF
jgi:hypothetical protein